MSQQWCWTHNHLYDSSYFCIPLLPFLLLFFCLSVFFSFIIHHITAAVVLDSQSHAWTHPISVSLLLPLLFFSLFFPPFPVFFFFTTHHIISLEPAFWNTLPPQECGPKGWLQGNTFFFP